MGVGKEVDDHAYDVALPGNAVNVKVVPEQTVAADKLIEGVVLTLTTICFVAVFAP